jgi:hypothetical protein
VCTCGVTTRSTKAKNNREGRALRKSNKGPEIAKKRNFLRTSILIYVLPAVLWSSLTPLVSYISSVHC